MTDLEDDEEDPECEHPQEMLDSTEGFLDLIEKITHESFGALETVGGNLLFHIPEVATRVVVTSGRNKGLHRVTIEEPVHFVLVAHQWALLQLLDPGPGRPTVGSMVEAGALFLDGDLEVYDRFMRLDENRKSTISIRQS